MKIYYPVLLDFDGEVVDMGGQYTPNPRQAGVFGKMMLKKYGAFAKSYTVKMMFLTNGQLASMFTDIEKRELY